MPIASLIILHRRKEENILCTIFFFDSFRMLCLQSLTNTDSITGVLLCCNIVEILYMCTFSKCNDQSIKSMMTMIYAFLFKCITIFLWNIRHKHLASFYLTLHTKQSRRQTCLYLYNLVHTAKTRCNQFIPYFTQMPVSA